MREHHLEVPRTARYYAIGEPGAAVREVWFACHGYGQLGARFARHFEPLAEESRLIIVPEALNRFYLDPTERAAAERRVGATWMTREDRETDIADTVRYLDRLFARVMAEVAPGARVHVLGFSQGVATVVRWLALGSATAHALTLWAGALPHDLDLAPYAGRFMHLRITLVQGDADPYVAHVDAGAQGARLAAAGIPHAIRRFAGEHRLDAGTLRALAGD